MTDRDQPRDGLDEETQRSPAPGTPDGATAGDVPTDATHDSLPPHPPFARSSDDYMDPPGHHRRPDGAATDVGG